MWRGGKEMAWRIERGTDLGKRQALPAALVGRQRLGVVAWALLRGCMRQPVRRGVRRSVRQGVGQGVCNPHLLG